MPSEGCDLDCIVAWSNGEMCPHGIKQTDTYHVPNVVRLNKQLKFMWNKFGPGPEGKRCKDCVRCGYVQYAKRYYKCSFYGNTSSAATDWRANWPACGIFEGKSENNPRDQG